jgi:hypothetical protein
MSKNAQNILSRLDGLDLDDLVAVAAQAQARAALLGSGKPVSASGNVPAEAEDAEARLVYESAAEAMKGTLGAIPPYGAFRKGHVKAKAFAEGASALLAYARQYLKPKGKPELVKAVNYLVGLIVRERVRKARRRPGLTRPLDMFSFVDDLPRVASIVDSQFPDYAESGLLPMLLRRHPDARRLARVG